MVAKRPTSLGCIKSDWKRFGSVMEALGRVSFAVTLWFRISTWFMHSNMVVRILGIPVYLLYRLIKLTSGIQLPIGTRIGPGIRFFHYNCVVIANETIIGENVSIHQGVTIGRVFNGHKAGVPSIGNRVVIFAGAKIVGNVTIGDDVVIGANAVVIDDIPSNSVCVGNPARVVSADSSRCFDDEWSMIFGRSQAKGSAIDCKSK